MSTQNKLYGIALYLAITLVLYGRQEVLPKGVIKALDTDELLKSAKRDPKEVIYFVEEIATLMGTKGVKNMHELGEAYKDAK